MSARDTAPARAPAARLDPSRRAGVRDLYDDYAAVLDEGDYEAWPGFFAEDCVYRVTTRENVEANLPLSLIAAESAAMLRDRVRAIRETMMFGPRSYRRFVSGLRAFEGPDGRIDARGNLLIIETLVDKPSHIALCGRFEDELTGQDGALRIASRLIVLDTEMMPNSLIYPL